MIRAFIAVELPDSLRQEVATLQSELRAAGADVGWVKTENLHLTLKFLGDIEENQVQPLVLSLSPPKAGPPPAEKEGSGLGVGPFTFSLEGIGAFPKTTYPRVIWVGVNQGKEELEKLALGVEKACVELGFAAEERPFSAHLTIGRVRSKDQLAGLIKKLQVAEFRGSAPAPVDRILLFQSTLSPHGPTYTPLAEIPLG